VETHCCRSPVACATWGLFVGSRWPLDYCRPLCDGGCMVEWSSTSCSLGLPHFGDVPHLLFPFLGFISVFNFPDLILFPFCFLLNGSLVAGL